MSHDTPALPPQAVLSQMINGYWLATAICTAARLGLADEVRDTPTATKDIAVAIGADAGALYRLLRALVGPRPEQQSLVVRKIGTLQWSVYGSAAYLEAHPWKGSLDEHDVVAFGESLAHIPSAQWLAAASARTRVTVRMTSPLTGASAVRSGWGLAVLPDFVARTDAALVRVSSEPVASDEVWIAVHPDLQHTPRIRAVIEHLVAAAHRAGVVAAPAHS